MLQLPQLQNEAAIKISGKNIRATALKQFWGSEYPESLYLWEGAKHPLTLSEMDQVTDETMADIFAAPAETAAATKFCQQTHEKMLPRLAAKLSEVSGLALPDTFWRTALGYWLYRHICVTYEKYAYLSTVDVDRTSLQVLDRGSFYTPRDHMDYLYCFCTDFGVQQLVSQYYLLFAEKEFPSVPLRFERPAQRRTLSGYGKDCLRKGWRVLKACSATARKTVTGVEPQVALCGFFNTPAVGAELFARSGGRIAPVTPPTVQAVRPADEASRKRLLEIPFDNDFEYFFVQTLYYCLPQMFIEQFRPVYDACQRDIRKRGFTHIVSESWISDMFCSIYVATAQHEGRTFIAHEHGSGTVFDKTLTYWIDVMASHRYITVGWEMGHDKVVPGGFVCRDIIPYQFQASKRNILYVARTNLPYMMEFNIYNVPNTKTINSLKRVRAFFELLPERLSDNLKFRPRREPKFWDTEHALEVRGRNIKVDTGVFSDSLGNARIVVIDHLSTGAAEIMLRRIPCLIIQEKNSIAPVCPELSDIYTHLGSCGILHHSAASAAAHLDKVYDTVQQWWTSEPVQAAVNHLVSATLGPPSKTVDRLLLYAGRNPGS